MTIKRAAAFPGAGDIVLLGGVRAERLADRWRSATSFESLRGRAFAHPTFADFAELGEQAVAVAVDRLAFRDDADLWLDVLAEIADGPESTRTDIDGLVEAWRRWAREQGLRP